jgi:transcriptional regulator with AAA-type ATPase domain
MKMRLKLTGTDREFYGLVAQAASCNPFSDNWVDLATRIAGTTHSTPTAETDRGLARRVTDRVLALEARGKTDIRLYGAEDRYLIVTALLFEVIQHFYPQFDQLILDQLQAGETSCPFPFASEVLSTLARRGFEPAEARRYLGILYQVRRAYYFIDRGLLGKSRCMKELRLHLWNSVFTHDIRWYDLHLWNRMEDFSTLLLGETGTGKGTAAAAIGRSGFIPFDEKRRCFAESFMRSFITLNLSQYTPALIESELFGHKKGAFTGAIEAHQGIFARSSQYGAILLDEIGEVAVPIQIKLLQVLQERTFSPVGSHEKLRFQGRVVAATNKPLGELRGKGSFRDDFFYRLSSDVITVPPLRQRLREDPSELDELLSHIVQRLIGKEATDLVEMVRDAIQESVGDQYAWPGNVREMEQAVRRILLTQRYQGDHKSVAPDLRSQLVSGIESGNLDADGVLSGYCRLLYERHGTYEEVARRTHLDRRTVKAYLEKQSATPPDASGRR